ncbi:MAG: corrinoid protein [candidate division WOR-3 bacterium]|jgi:5-methyltetrahydrofolate--homocysteine methyltransferase|nr:corrinoid protein [candidate division WOR-3 bacterium]MDH7519743.1 corrinoid protein [bacterium]
MENSRDLFSLLVDAVVALDPVRVAQLCQEALRQGLAPEEALEKGLARGMRVVGEKFAAREFFVPEVLLASKAMYAGFDILKEQLPRGTRSRGRVALGVVQGDIHDIGKNIVKVMVQAAGFEVVDLGRNVPIERFVTAAEEGVQIVGMSSLMTTTMPNMAKVIEALKKQGLRERVKVLVGGAPVTRLFAERIGADGYAPDAHSAVVEVERLLK